MVTVKIASDNKSRISTLYDLFYIKEYKDR